MRMKPESRIGTSSPPVKDEAYYISRAKEDPRFFEPVYNAHYEKIFRYCYQRLNSEDDAADVCSQVFIKAMSKLKLFKDTGVPFSAWLYRIAHNELMDFFRKNQKKRTVNMDLSNLKVMLDDCEEDKSEENMQRLVNLLRQLKEEELNIIEMKYFEGRSFQEISQITGLSVSNAKVKAFRIIQKMKKKVNK